MRGNWRPSTTASGGGSVSTDGEILSPFGKPSLRGPLLPQHDRHDRQRADGHDYENFERSLVDHDRAPDDLRGAALAPLPEAVAEQRHRLEAGRRGFVRAEPPPQDRLHRQRPEQAGVTEPPRTRSASAPPPPRVTLRLA